MTFDIISIFPHAFDSYFNESILKRAQKKNLIKINIHNLRDYTLDKHKKVDDKPYGGGQGMILQVEPFYRALANIKMQKSKIKMINQNAKLTAKTKTIMLTPTGKTLDQKMAMKLSKLDNVILLCGRYEGFDARIDKFVDEKISIGNYVLSGGELPAMVLVETVTRLIPGVLGHSHSAEDDTFSVDKDYVEYPQFTRPEKFQIPNPKQITNSKKQKTKTLSVPKVLLSGDHKKIEEWKMKHIKTKK